MLGEKTKLHTIRAVQTLTTTDADQLFCNSTLAWLFIFRGCSVVAAVQTLTIIILLCVERGKMGLTLSNERDWQPSECLISMIGFSFVPWQVHKKANSIWTAFIAFTVLLRLGWVSFYGVWDREIQMYPDQQKFYEMIYEHRSNTDSQENLETDILQN